MSRIFWDTNIYIYLLKGSGPFFERAVALRKAMLTRGDHLLTSALTLGEVLVKPVEEGNTSLCRKYDEAILASSQVIPFDAKAARIYAALRCDRSLRAPDAIQLACAARTGTDLFITNDLRLQGKKIEGIQFIVALEHAPL